MKNATGTYKNLKWAYRKPALSRAQVFRWHKAFWMAMRLWKTNLVLKDLAHEKQKKI
jgi:hypothetical protein